MRHVRISILGLSLVAVLVASAIGAGSALASKDPWNITTWGQHKYCEYYVVFNEGSEDCFYGRTSGGIEGGEFKYGHVAVKLSKPVVIQGAYEGAGSEILVRPAVNGGETLEAPPLPVQKGLAVITPKIQEEANWPAALKESFKAAKIAKETKAFATIEMAGNECFEVRGCLNTGALLFEEGTAFRLALKVKVTSPWLEKLGGGPCYIGSDENPVKQNLTSSGAGRAGDIEFNEAFTQVELKGGQLVDVGWHISKASGASGCGGPEYESYVDKALNLALEVENASGEERTLKTGITWLTGDLFDAAREAVNEQHEAGNPELP